jgi:hypothetical protein
LREANRLHVRRIPGSWHAPTLEDQVSRGGRRLLASGVLRLLAGVCWGAREADEHARAGSMYGNVLMAAISVRVPAVGCVTMPSKGCRCLMLHPPKPHVMGSRAPLQAGAGRDMAHISISGRYSARMRPMIEAQQRPPQIALGYPWASSLVCRLHARPCRTCWAQAWWSDSL